MKIIDSLVTGDVNVTSDTQYNNMVAENVTINENITARIYGIIHNEITIAKDATLYLHGKHYGQLINHGGKVQMY
jgi:hypothetical protein